MRLSKLKLSGFKSFVDPTVVPLPSNLNAVVGPNGCGKSNIIDAVRWVMGESSAKHLRGESMADVIFNGSSARKPVGQATVELLFDNSDGSLGGEYANYNEISVKRTVSRDGSSVYHLNNTRCRRRDVTDIFLGTGLGPRSYSIIEQGTISRLIEAKPEELRAFLEEAAGISRYKERRRETENRIRHTRENLDRLNDLREELEKQIARLKRQANTAERYKVLKEQERLVKAQLQTLRWSVLNEQSSSGEHLLREEETALEQAIAKQREVESGIEKQRSKLADVTDSHNVVQSRFYGVGADIARLEQSIQHARERRAQQQIDLGQLDKDGEEAQHHLVSDQEKIKTLEAQKAEIEPDLKALTDAESESVEALAIAEEAMQSLQTNWDNFNQQAAQPARDADVQRTRIEHLDKLLSQLQQRGEKVHRDMAEQAPDVLERELSELKQSLSESESKVTQSRELLQRRQNQITELRETNHLSSAKLDELRSELQNNRGRSASLEALQQAALGKEKGAVSQWLSGQHLQDAPRLAEELSVESGWEQAAECVLGTYLEAVCIEDVDPLTDVLGSFDEGTLTLFDTRVAANAAAKQLTTPLSSKVTAPWSLDSIIDGVYVADDLPTALSLRNALAAHESVVTRDGIWLGQGWLRVTRDSDAKAGILQREQELKVLANSATELSSQSEALKLQLEEGQIQLRDLELERDAAQSDVNHAQHQFAEHKNNINTIETRFEQVQNQQKNLLQEHTEINQQMESHQADLKSARSILQTALDAMSGHEQQREQLIREREIQRATLDVTKARAQQARNDSHELKIKVETLNTELKSTRQALERLESQFDQVTTRREEIQKSLTDSEAPVETMSSELEVFLEQRVTVEAELSEARKNLDQIEHEQRELEQARSRTEQDVQDVRGKLEQIRIHQQEVKVRRQTLEEQIAETRFVLQELVQAMPEEANENEWQSQVEELEGKISRLGPINLAAIEEFEQQSERKEYLDKQNADLEEALTTLEAAISKIDKETRTRFKETFDKVNSGLKRLFPRLFGGGHAYLELTEDDLLNAGVTVMARPPGKRNSTIHLLSGGEKALTAVALVFSIFELNPAPFCILDEVDAPLDDANVGRYSQMVKEMSDRIQFIFITHNKVSMEVATHLTGVTMHEPGVSRLVAVDIDDAVEMAAV
jgi:chromosome segregation protein